MQEPERVQAIALPRRVRAHQQRQRGELDRLVGEALEVDEPESAQHGPTLPDAAGAANPDDIGYTPERSRLVLALV